MPPLDEQYPLGVREQAPHLGQEPRTGCAREHLPGQHQGDVIAGSREVLQRGERLVR
jgi:hypothetical protein